MRAAKVIQLPAQRPWKTLAATVRERGYQPVYVEGQYNRCPGCGRSAWHVGRHSAECANEACGTALPLVSAEKGTGR